MTQREKKRRGRGVHGWTKTETEKGNEIGEEDKEKERNRDIWKDADTLEDIDS